ncbi:MAG: hypothetical protein ABH983_05555 [Candidatus Micrarchaeota archaeon]|nr:hypothetical protein [Candidatus Micrarchaeota archaeon]MBU1681213.1 hypothetical protein [Candidatus Micrarchaeota archaeon]
MKNYKPLDRQYDYVSSQSKLMFSQECELLEDLIAFSFARYFHLNKDGLSDLEQELAALFYRNCIYISATYRLVTSGLLDPAGNNLRTVFETIIWQYAYKCELEIFENQREMNQLEEQKLANEWSGTKERKLQNLRRKYSFQKMMKNMYSKETYENFFFNQYWILSQKSHASVFGVNNNTPSMEGKTTLEKNPKELQKNLSASLYFCAESLICFLNCFSKRLTQAEIDLSLKKLNQVNQIISPTAGLAPDKKNLEFTIQFREIN